MQGRPISVHPADLAHLDTIGLSFLDEHSESCCRVAKALLMSRLTSEAHIAAALAAIPNVVTWAPTRWPTSWCRLATPEGTGYSGDCGAHAHIASEVLTLFGVPHRRGRIAIAVSPEARAHWSATWASDGVGAAWLSSDLTHHEALRVGDAWWDPGGACWFTGPGARLNCGHVVATREHGGLWELSGRQHSGA